MKSEAEISRWETLTEEYYENFFSVTQRRLQQLLIADVPDFSTDIIFKSQEVDTSSGVAVNSITYDQILSFAKVRGVQIELLDIIAAPFHDQSAYLEYGERLKADVAAFADLQLYLTSNARRPLISEGILWSHALPWLMVVWNW